MSVISIDLWGTLIKGSPLFHQKKIELLREFFPGVNSNTIIEAFAKTKKELNNIIEATGWQPEQELMFRMLVSNIQVGFNKNQVVFVDELADRYQELAKKFPPLFYSDETKKYLKLLAKKNELVLSSNTLLLDHFTIYSILKNSLKIDGLFVKMNLSGHLGFGKPRPEMYENSKWHIGDNSITDGRGAVSANSIPITINTTNLTIKDAYEIITLRG